MTFLVERNGRELSQIISDKTNKMNKLSATFTDASRSGDRPDAVGCRFFGDCRHCPHV